MTDVAPPAGSAAAPPAGGAPTPPGGAPAGGSPGAAATARPEWLPETYFDPTAGGIKPEFGAHYAEVSAFHKTQTEAQAALKARKPEDIKFEVKLPDTVKVPEGMKVEVDPKDPRVAAVRTMAVELGLDQPVVDRLVALDAQWKIEAHNAEVARVAEEDKKLGDNGKARTAAISAWAGTLGLSADELSEIRMTATTAAGVTALEKLMAKVSGSVPGTGGAPPQIQKPAEVPMADRWYGGTQQKVS